MYAQMKTQYFELVRSGGAGDDIIIELVETMYEDYNIEAEVEYSYKLAHMIIMETSVATLSQF